MWLIRAHSLFPQKGCGSSWKGKCSQNPVLTACVEEPRADRGVEESRMDLTCNPPAPPGDSQEQMI